MAKSLPFRTRYQPFESPAVITGPTDDGRTQQHHAEKCDINRIVKKYLKTGMIDHPGRASDVFLDTTKFKDLAESQNLMAQVRELFQSLPAYERELFNNNMLDYANFMTDPRHEEARIARGYQKPRVQTNPTPANDASVGTAVPSADAPASSDNKK